MDLYHKDIGLPAAAANAAFAGFVKYTAHARTEAAARGITDLPTIFDTRNATLIEVGIENGKIVKALYRQQYDPQLDLCIVLNPENLKVLTVWLNESGDHHRTLQEDRYAAP